MGRSCHIQQQLRWVGGAGCDGGDDDDGGGGDEAADQTARSC